MKRIKKISIILVIAMAFSLLQVGLPGIAEVGINVSGGLAYAANGEYEVIEFYRGEGYIENRLAVNGKYFYLRKGSKSDIFMCRLYCADSKNGKGRLVVKGYLGSSILTDGKTVYYLKYNKDTYENTICKVNVNGKGKKALKDLGEAYWNYSFVESHKNNIYLKAWDSTSSNLYSFNTKTKKLKNVLKASMGNEERYLSPVILQRGDNYFYTAYDKSIDKSKFNVYNFRTGKKKTLLKNDEFEQIGNDVKPYIVSKKYVSDDTSVYQNYDCEFYEVNDNNSSVKKLDEFSAMNIFDWKITHGTGPDELLLFRVENNKKAGEKQLNVYDWSFILRDTATKEEKKIYESKGAEDVWTYYFSSDERKYEFMYFGLEPASVYKYEDDYTDESGELIEGYYEQLYNIKVYGIRDTKKDVKAELLLELKDVAMPSFVNEVEELNAWVDKDIKKIDDMFFKYLELKRDRKNTIQYYKAVNLFDKSEKYQSEVKNEVYEAVPGDVG